MSCAILLRLSPLIAAALAASEARPLECHLNEAQCFLQGEVRVTRIDPDPANYVAGAEPQGPSPLGDQLRDRLENFRPPDQSNQNSTSSEGWQKALSLEVNKAGDLAVLGLSFATNAIALLVCLVAFVCLRNVYPELYENNARSLDEGGLNTAPFLPDEGNLGWASSALQVTEDQMRTCVGVDEMMLIEFANFSMRLLFLIGMPLLCILCPLHLFTGSGEVDRLSKVGMANMKEGSPLLWVHVVMVWYVVLVTEHNVNEAMHRFLEVRVRWLLELEPPRSTTVLVEGIPEDRRSDAELKAYFDMLFPGCIESVYLVKKTRWLSKLTRWRERARLRLEQAMFEFQQNDEDPSRRPTRYSNWFMRIFGRFVGENDKIEYYKEQLNRLESETDTERQRVLDASTETMIEEEDSSGHLVRKLTERAKAVNTHAGFVTFTSEREARLMLSMRCTASNEDWITHVPPQHEDTIYEDLQVQLNEMKLSHLLGYACVAGVFFSFLPLICGIGTLASFEAFKRHFHIEMLAPEAGMIFEGVVASLALTTFTSFLPTILMLVFSTFFILRAHAWAQLKLQTWLFWFNLIFVVLVTSLGGTLIGRIKDAMQSPFEILTFLADSLPHFTHFYLNYMLMQWVIHALNLTRYIQLIKYLIWRAMVGPERAVVLTEPEDQDYYGIGSRSAQWTINLVISIVFCTLCPLITIFTFINFFITRVVYGYLVVFAEIRKPDLGGPFFVTQLWHTQYGLLVYTVLMVGVIWHHSKNNWAMTIAVAPTIFYVLFGFYQFYINYQWEALPFEELCTDEAREDFAEQINNYRALGENRPCYRQEELFECDSIPSSPKLEELRKPTRASRRLSLAGDLDQSSITRRRACTRSSRSMNANMMVGPSNSFRRTSTVLDVGLNFVNRHFAEWGNAQGEESGEGRVSRRSSADWARQSAASSSRVDQDRLPVQGRLPMRRVLTLDGCQDKNRTRRSALLSDVQEQGSGSSLGSSDSEEEGPEKDASHGGRKGSVGHGGRSSGAFASEEPQVGKSWSDASEAWDKEVRRYKTS